MRIGLLAPPFESIPPQRYGGTERVIATLADALVERGHQVRLFASGDSQTRAELVETVPRAVWREADFRDSIPLCTRAVAIAYAHADELDLIHNHLDHFAYAAARLSRTPTLSTLHWSLEYAEQGALYEEFDDVPLVSISFAQRRPVPRARWVANIPHGYPKSLYRPSFEGGRYLAFCGRFAREKGADLAIDAAIAAGLPIKIASRLPELNPRNQDSLRESDYFEHEIRHRLAHPLVEFVGELDDRQKQSFYAGAMALLCPIRWEEPFGLVMIESLACGTPVLATPMGSVPEVIEHGVQGYHCRGLEDFVRGIARLDRIDRADCREAFEERFDADRMAQAYEAVYMRLVERTSIRVPGPRPTRPGARWLG